MSEDLDDIVENLREPSAWIRIIFMVGFALVLYLIIAPIVLVLMIVQALFSVFAGESNFNLRRFGGSLGKYVLQILQFLTYNSHDKPFPFSDFPPLEDDPGEETKTSAKSTAAASKSSKPATARKKTAARKTAKKKSPARKAASSKVADKTEGNSEGDGEGNSKGKGSKGGADA